MDEEHLSRTLRPLAIFIAKSGSVIKLPQIVHYALHICLASLDQYASTARCSKREWRREERKRERARGIAWCLLTVVIDQRGRHRCFRAEKKRKKIFYQRNFYSKGFPITVTTVCRLPNDHARQFTDLSSRFDFRAIILSSIISHELCMTSIGRISKRIAESFIDLHPTFVFTDTRTSPPSNRETGE